jgi:hypothetical protein
MTDLIHVGPDGQPVVDGAALLAALDDRVARRKVQQVTYPTDEQLAELDDTEFLLVVAAAYERPVDLGNRGISSARTKFATRTRDRVARIEAARAEAEADVGPDAG